MVAALLLGGAAALAVPPPPEQFAANCESPTYASDMLVCGDTSLRALDARMREAWEAVDFASVVAPGAWVEAQPDWFKRRSLCAFGDRHAECLQDAYVEHIAVLEALRLVASRPPRQGAAAVCAGAPWGRATVRIRAPLTGALVIEGTEAGVLAAAKPLHSVSAWTPYVGFGVEGASVGTGRAIASCTVMARSSILANRENPVPTDFVAASRGLRLGVDGRAGDRGRRRRLRRAAAAAEAARRPCAGPAARQSVRTD
jgi:uncharacterized protein